MPQFEICFTEHELCCIRVSGKDKEEVRRRFERGDLDWDSTKYTGDFGGATLNNIVELKDED